MKGRHSTQISLIVCAVLLLAGCGGSKSAGGGEVAVGDASGNEQSRAFDAGLLDAREVVHKDALDNVQELVDLQHRKPTDVADAWSPDCGDVHYDNPKCDDGCAEDSAGDFFGTELEVCSPDCSAKQCGDDGCGGTCGICATTEDCVANQCVCVADCTAKECGDDGCGGSCGECVTEDPCLTPKCIVGHCSYSPIEDCCTSDAHCDDQNKCTEDLCDASHICVNMEVVPCCGDGFMEDGESCDDGNTEEWDGCTTGCIEAEMQVNTHVSGNQYNPAIAPVSGGGHLVAWSSMEQDGDSTGVFARWLDGEGNKLGDEFQVNDTTVGWQCCASIATSESGTALVVWTSEEDNDNSGVYGKLLSFGDQGSTEPEFRVGTMTTGKQYAPDVAAVSDGGFVVVWTYFPCGQEEACLVFRFVDSEGTSTGDELVAVSGAGSFKEPNVSFAGANLLLTWEEDPGDDGLQSIKGQYFSPDGAAKSDPMTLVVSESWNWYNHTSTATASGDLLLAWEGTHLVSLEFQTNALKVALFSSDGAQSDFAWVVATDYSFWDTVPFFYPSIAATPDGQVALALTQTEGNGADSVTFSLRDAALANVVAQLTVNSMPLSVGPPGAKPVLSINDDGSTAFIVWTSCPLTEETTQDGDACGIFARRVPL